MPESCELNDGHLSDSVNSATSSSPNSNARSSRTSPNCNKCKNHNLTVLLRGHKRYCKYSNCRCQPCRLTEERRRVMAAQTRQKRAQQQDERAGVPVEERAPVQHRPLSESVDISYSHPVVEVPRSPPPTLKPVPHKRRYAQKEILQKSLMRASMVYERPSIFSHGPNYVPDAHSYSLPFTPYRPFANGGGALSLVDPSRRPSPTN